MKKYLGDGLCAEDDGFTFLLTCQNDKIILEPHTIATFLKFLEERRNITITVESNHENKLRSQD